MVILQSLRLIPPALELIGAGIAGFEVGTAISDVLRGNKTTGEAIGDAAIGVGVGLTIGGTGKLLGNIVGKVVKSAPNITKAYKRPSGATNQAQRKSVQGKPCVDCGVTTSKQFADHKDPLVKEFYRTGTIDKTHMRDVGSVQPHCPTCSSRQGAGLSRYSRQMKKDHGLD